MDILAWILGLLGASTIAILGAYLGRRGEHAKWVREKRLDAYLEFMVAADTHFLNARDKSTRESVVGLMQRETAIDLLGPKTVKDAARVMRKALMDLDDNLADVDGRDARLGTYWAAQREASVVARRVLKINY